MMPLDILSFDQQATLAVNGSNSLFWDNVMYTVTDTFSWSLLIAMLIYILFKNTQLKGTLFILITIGLMIFVADRICSGMVKPMVGRWRPAQDPELMYLVDIVNGYRGGRFGFYSGHACNTCCMATFLALLFRSTRLTFILYFWSFTTTYTRLYLGVHYIGDVTVGFIVGATIGVLFYLLYYKLRQRFFKAKLISEQFTSTGFLKSDINRFIATVFVNYILVITIALTRGIS